jgi:hypothetical protein
MYIIHPLEIDRAASAAFVAAGLGGRAHQVNTTAFGMYIHHPLEIELPLLQASAFRYCGLHVHGSGQSMQNVPVAQEWVWGVSYIYLMSRAGNLVARHANVDHIAMLRDNARFSGLMCVRHRRVLPLQGGRSTTARDRRHHLEHSSEGLGA